MRALNFDSQNPSGLQKKRAILGGKNAPTLSQLLEEAKNRPAESSSVKGEEIEENPLCYSRLFDEYHGVVHLEALELLSRECIAKVCVVYCFRLCALIRVVQ